VRDSFTELRAPDSVVADFELAVSELVANLVEYGDGRDLTVCVDADDAQWLMEVHGGRVIPVALRDPDRWAVSRGEDDRGRGLGIVRAVMSRVRVERVDGVVVVRCSVPIVPA
jgi:anti-sigma regulatory factor (Ser/Thr protein kinase)